MYNSDRNLSVPAAEDKHPVLISYREESYGHHLYSK